MPQPIDGKRREAFEALVQADVLALATTGKIEPWVAAATMRAAVVDEHWARASSRRIGNCCWTFWTKWSCTSSASHLCPYLALPCDQNFGFCCSVSDIAWVTGHPMRRYTHQRHVAR